MIMIFFTLEYEAQLGVLIKKHGLLDRSAPIV